MSSWSPPESSRWLAEHPSDSLPPLSFLLSCPPHKCGYDRLVLLPASALHFAALCTVYYIRINESIQGGLWYAIEINQVQLQSNIKDVLYFFNQTELHPVYPVLLFSLYSYPAFLLTPSLLVHISVLVIQWHCTLCLSCLKAVNPP